jgi:hypothetical protein
LKVKRLNIVRVGFGSRRRRKGKREKFDCHHTRKPYQFKKNIKGIGEGCIGMGCL